MPAVALPLSARKRAALFVLFASAAFAASSPLARLARPTHPLLIAFGRVALAALFFLALDARAIGASVRRLARAQRWSIFAAGALLAGHFALFQLGLDHTSIAAAVSLISLQPLGVVLLSWAILGLRPTRIEQIGIVIATVGALVVAQGQGQGEHRLAGDLLVVAAVVLYGLYLTVARALKDALPARSYVALVYTGAAIALGLGIAIPGVAPSAFPLPLHGALAIAAIALVPTVLGHTAVQIASRSLSPAIVALASPGETIGGIALGAALFGAVPTATEMAGALIILAGAGILLTAKRLEPHPTPTSS